MRMILPPIKERRAVDRLLSAFFREYKEVDFKKAIAIEPDNAAAHGEIGLFYMRCGNNKAAVDSLRKAYQLNPGAPGVVAALADLGAFTTAPGGRRPPKPGRPPMLTSYTAADASP